MALTKDTNSYVTVAEADSFFADRLQASEWTTADNKSKSKALITATSIIDSFDYAGTAVSGTLAFPRNGFYFDPRAGRSLAMATVPSRVLTATCELALHLLSNSDLLSDTGGVKSIEVGSISIEGLKDPSQVPSMVSKLLKPLKVNGGSDGWWRNN